MQRMPAVNLQRLTLRMPSRLLGYRKLSEHWALHCSAQSEYTLRDLPLEKHFQHSEHEKGHSRVWSFWCKLRPSFSLKCFLRSEGGKGPVWVLWGLVNSLFCLKHFLHFEHEKGLSMVWILWCVCRYFFLGSTWKLVYPRLFWCSRRFSFLRKAFPTLSTWIKILPLSAHD